MADSADLAFAMQLELLYGGPGERPEEKREPEPPGRSRWNDYFLEYEGLDSPPPKPSIANLIEQSMVRRAIAASVRQSMEKSVSTPPIGNSGDLSDSEELYHSASESNLPNLRTVTHDQEDVDPELLQQALLYSLKADERHSTSTSQDVKSEAMGSYASEGSGFLRAASSKLTDQYEQEQLEKAVAEIESEMAAKEQQQLWQDEILAKQIQRENAEGFASTADSYENQTYDLYYAEARDDQGHVGIGCVMKDREGFMVFENREYVGLEVSHHFAEYTALINGLAYARSTGVTKINAHGNPAFIYCEVKGLAELWSSEQLELLNTLREQVVEFRSFDVDCVSKAEIKGAFDLAKRAINLHVAEHRNKRNRLPSLPSLKGKTPVKEREQTEGRCECPICYEKIFASDMVYQKVCDHRFCFNCLSQHVENEIMANKIPVRCPQFYACSGEMALYDCQHFLTPKLFDIYARRLTEATISDSDKVYCPFPNCSAMMCRPDGSNSTSNGPISLSSSTTSRIPIGGAECMECHRLFCVECQVPWHASLTCQQYQKLPADERDAEDIKLFQLAKDENWRRCKQCGRMIILSHGCFHITCRCGNEFCYTCETQYVKKKKMCKCPLFRNFVPVQDARTSGRIR